MCLYRSIAAVERAWDQIGERALKVCIETGEACCFERLPDGYDFVPPHPLPHNVSIFQEKKRACDLQCARELDRKPTENATCRPSIVSAPHDPEHHRTAAMRAVVSECQHNPDAIAKCASLRGMVTRETCKLECRMAHPPSPPPEAPALADHSPPAPSSTCRPSFSANCSSGSHRGPRLEHLVREVNAMNLKRGCPRELEGSSL